MLFRKTILLLLIIAPFSGLAQAVDFKANSKTKPVTYERLHVEIVVGLGLSKLPSRPYYPLSNLLSPYAEVALPIPLSAHWRLRPSANYQVIGSSLKFGAPQGGTAIANSKLTYLSAQVQAGYLLSKPTNRIQTEVQGGFFAAKQLDDLTVNRIPGQGVSRLKSIDSSIGYNYGLVSGLGVSTLLNQRHHLGLRLLYHQGILDIRTPTGQQNTGELPIVTQAFSLCSFFAI